MGQVMCEAQGGSLEILKGLVGIDTTNPPGREREAALWLEGLLEGYGFLCEVQDLGDGRANLVAVAEGLTGIWTWCRLWASGALLLLRQWSGTGRFMAEDPVI